MSKSSHQKTAWLLPPIPAGTLDPKETNMPRKHYLTDILAGIAIGLAAEAAVAKLVPVRR